MPCPTRTVCANSLDHLDWCGPLHCSGHIVLPVGVEALHSLCRIRLLDCGLDWHDVLSPLGHQDPQLFSTIPVFTIQMHLMGCLLSFAGSAALVGIAMSDQLTNFQHASHAALVASNRNGPRIVAAPPRPNLHRPKQVRLSSS